ncbi:MAG: hypothetical protein KJ583_04205 [Nanoarchaeota archaeon]|nr:hypothetical protein [Nanoarchaeota archaeon]MBU1269092.1 hypothetical protein [Nanoarchaeota archaeon]MBU1604496.1 hypothetical protein [Nanoarchaeota archaeon]
MTFMMLVFTITFVVVQKRTLDVSEAITDRLTTQVSNVIKNEVDMANSALNGYKKQFQIPDYINGENYTIYLIDNSEIAITYRDKTHVVFLPVNISGSISQQKGHHVIKKENGNITVGVGKIR